MAHPTTPVRYRDGVPVYRYDPAPGVPPVHAFRLGPDHLPNDGRRHIHDFPVVVSDGDSAWLVQAGAVIDPATDIPHNSVAVAFDPTAVDAALLAPLRRRQGPGLVHVAIPPDDRELWRHTIGEIEREVELRRDGYRHALIAHLTVLLIELRRHASELSDAPEESLQAVFTAIEEGFRSPLTLRDVAKSVSLTPGYLTTWVRRRTGKTVQEWIIERKLVEARRLLAESDLPIASVAQAVGFRDPAYFTRVFTRDAGLSPRRWRAALPR